MKTATTEIINGASKSATVIDALTSAVAGRWTWDEVVKVIGKTRASQRVWQAFQAAMKEEWG